MARTSLPVVYDLPTLRAWLPGVTSFDEVSPLLDHPVRAYRQLVFQHTPGHLIPLGVVERHFKHSPLGGEMSVEARALCENPSLTSEHRAWVYQWASERLSEVLTKINDDDPLQLLPLRVIELLEANGYETPANLFPPFLERLRGRLPKGRQISHASIVLQRWTLHTAEDAEVIARATHGMFALDILLAQHPLTPLPVLLTLLERHPKSSWLARVLDARPETRGHPAVKAKILEGGETSVIAEVAHWLTEEEFAQAAAKGIEKWPGYSYGDLFQKREPSARAVAAVFRAGLANNRHDEVVKLLERWGTPERTTEIAPNEWATLLEAPKEETRLKGQGLFSKLKGEGRKLKR